MTNPTLDRDRAEFLAARPSNRRRAVPAWPRFDKELVLVQVEVTWVRFSTINHRTKAEQLREMDLTGRKDLFTADPIGDEAQEAQYRILTKQEGFSDLKADLRDRGQQEPAIITADGILINGNRRSAALRSLFQDDDYLAAKYVQCLVLPQDATRDELVDLETELQVARDFKEEYSWINEALLIEELYDREGKNFSRVAARMHRDASRVRSLHEKLQLVHQLVTLSQGARHYVDFTENESAFEELAKHIKNKSRADADAVRSVYLLGTLANVQYRKLRNLRREDAADLVWSELESDEALKPVLEMAQAERAAAVSDDPLDDLLGPDLDGSPLDATLAFLARRKPEETLTLPGGDRVTTQDVLDSMQSAITAVAEEAGEERRDQTAVRHPIDCVERALVQVKRAREVLPRARAFADWDESLMEAKLSELRESLETLEERS